MLSSPRTYFREFSPYVRWLRTPLGSLGSAAIASFLCGMILHPQGFILAFGITSVILVGVIWPKLSLLGLTGCVFFEKSRVREGDRVQVRASVRNRHPLSAWGLAIDAGCHRGQFGRLDDCAAFGLSVATGWRTTEATWDFIPACRGEYPLHSPIVASGFPFGLRSARASSWSEGLSWSGLGAIQSGLFPSRSLVMVPTVWRSATSRVPGDLLGVRPYRRGHSLRRIHWPQTARHGQLVVCEVQTTPSPGCWSSFQPRVLPRTPGFAPDGSWNGRYGLPPASSTAGSAKGWMSSWLWTDPESDHRAIPLETGRPVLGRPCATRARRQEDPRQFVARL